MIKIFVFQQTFAVFLLTQFLSIPIFVITQILGFFFISLYYIFVSKTKTFLTFLIGFIGILLAGFTTYISHTSKVQVKEDLLGSRQIEIEGEVIASRKDNTYHIRNTNGLFILRNSNENLKFGSKIFVKGQISTTSCEFCNFFFLKRNVKGPKFGVFNYDLRRWNQGIRGDIYAKKVRNIKANTKPVNISKNYFIEKLHQGLDNNTQKGLFSGMLFGDISKMDKEVYDTFVSSGLVHLVAVSGGNLVFLVLILMIALFRLPFYLRACVVGACMVIYTLIVGLDSSVFRALVMGLLLVGSRLVGRKNDVNRTLLLGWSILLVIDPYNLLYDLGFLLSFSALGGILLFLGLFKKFMSSRQPNKLLNYFKNFVIPTIGAFVGTFPVLVFYIGKLNFMNVIGNMLVIPAVLPIMIGGLGVIILPKSSFLSERIFSVISFVLDYIYLLANLVHKYGLFIELELLSIRMVFGVLGLLVLVLINNYIS